MASGTGWPTGGVANLTLAAGLGRISRVGAGLGGLGLGAGGGVQALESHSRPLGLVPSTMGCPLPVCTSLPPAASHSAPSLFLSFLLLSVSSLYVEMPTLRIGFFQGGEPGSP